MHTIKTYQKKLTGACVISRGVFLRCFLRQWRVNLFRVSVKFSVYSLKPKHNTENEKREQWFLTPTPTLTPRLFTDTQLVRCAQALTRIARLVRTYVRARKTHLGLVHVRTSFVKTGESNFEHDDCKKCCLKQFP